MQRNLTAMSENHYDLIIVGGGISGASIAWDASLRGLKVALLEKDDFAHATTSGSSKLIHGGLRYLVNGELSLVRESLRERRLWEQNAPHMVDPLPFLIPTYGKGMKGSLVLSIGLTMYDLLAYDRNRLNDPDKKLPGYKSLSKEEALAIMPSLNQEGLTGAKIYYDCQMFAPERLCLAFILGAAEKGADVANYAPVTGFVREGDTIKGVTVTDTMTGEAHTITGDLTVNAAGPWADIVMDKSDERAPSRRLIRSKGIHLITRDLSGDTALAVQSKIGGHFFVLPWRGKTILGTTDTVYDGDPDEIGVSEQDIEDFLAVVNDGLPGLGLSRKDVEHFYVGIRPLVDSTPADDSDNDDSYNASRAAEVVDHAMVDGIHGLVSAMGGKWTTSRHLAEQVVDLSVYKLNQALPACATETTALYGGDTGRFRPFVEQAVKTHHDISDDIVRNLTRYYGSRFGEVLATARERQGEEDELLAPLAEGSADIGAQIVHAVRHEMALTLTDALLRRSGIGTLGHPGKAIAQKAATLMARDLGWDEAETEKQIAAFDRAFATLEARG